MDRELLAYRITRLSPTLGPAVFALYRDIDDGHLPSHRLRELGAELVKLGADLSTRAHQLQRDEYAAMTRRP